MAGLTPTEHTALRLFKERLFTTFPDQVSSLQLFGSKARGDATKFSDVDVLVVLRDSAGAVRHAVHAVANGVFLETGVDLSPHVVTRDHLQVLRDHGSPLLRQIDHEGVAV